MASLLKKEYAPVYMLMGEEPYYIDKISDYIENNVLSEDEKAFNQMIIYGKDVENMASIVAAAKRYPMMAEYQVIIVKEAQQISNYDDLIFYLQNRNHLPFWYSVTNTNRSINAKSMPRIG